MLPASHGPNIKLSIRGNDMLPVLPYECFTLFALFLFSFGR